jgi:hypothetical protein
MKPTAYTKWFRTVYATFAAAILVAIAMNIPWIFGVEVFPAGRAMLAVLALMAAPVLLFVLMFEKPRRRQLKRIATSGEPHCPWCLHGLSSDSARGRCPECSASYTLDGVKQYWDGINIRLAQAKRTNFPPWDRWLLEDCGWR